MLNLSGVHSDLNETFPVGTIDEMSKKLIKTTYEALDLAVQHVKPGSMCRDFGDIISKHVHKQGFSVVRTYW
jgi:methionyl aminopeptidase